MTRLDNVRNMISKGSKSLDNLIGIRREGLEKFPSSDAIRSLRRLLPPSMHNF